MSLFVAFTLLTRAQSAEAVKYTEYISTEGYHPSANKCLRYNTKQSKDKTPIMQDFLENSVHPFIANAPTSTKIRGGSIRKGLSIGQRELFDIET